MKKLENIPKKNIYQVPDGYFDKLPMKIQARIETGSPKKQEQYYLRHALQYALPSVVLMVVAFLVFRPETKPEVNTLLSSVSTEQLIAYLEDSNLTTEELLDNFEFDAWSVEGIEQEVYKPFEFDSIELDLLTDEFETPNFLSNESDEIDD